ncbi:serine recombinase [Rhodococcus qingshengii]|uniref:serine recombinase n=1 Tax=Rhodococcus qingshengii TaxID=334542 RepID=UPI0035D764F4
MSAAVDRMWDIRDAVLAWLYEEAAKGVHSPHLDVDEIQESVGWAAEPISVEEIGPATMYLKDEGLISGTASWGGGVLRPSITSDGQKQAASGQSVRPGPPIPANTTGVTNYNTVHNHGTGNFNLGGNNVTQNLTVEQQIDKVIEVAEALEKFASEESASGENARAVAEDLRSAAGDPVGNKTRLQALLSSAIAAVAVAAGSQLGLQVTQLAVGAIQSLG